MLSQDTKARALDLLAGATPFALPAAQRREEDDLVAQSPGGIPAGLDYAGGIGRDHARRGYALGALGQPQVQVVDRGGLHGDGDGSRRRLGFGTLANSNAGRSYRFLEHGSPSLAQNGASFS